MANPSPPTDEEISQELTTLTNPATIAEKERKSRLLSEQALRLSTLEEVGAPFKEEALQLARKAFEISKSIDDWYGMLSAANKEASILISQRKLDEALQLYEKVCFLVKKERPEKLFNRVKVRHCTGWGNTLRFTNNLDLRYQKLRQALEFAKKIPILQSKRDQMAKSYKYLGDHYRQIGNYEEALGYYNRSLRNALEEYDSNITERTYLYIGVVKASVGELSNALKEITKVDRYINRYGWQREHYRVANIRMLYEELGFVFLVSGWFDLAIKFFENSIYINNKTNDRFSWTYSMIQKIVTLCLKDLKNCRSIFDYPAENNYENYQEIVNQMDNLLRIDEGLKYMVVRKFFTIANVFLSLFNKDFRKACEYAERAMQEAQETQNPFDKVLANLVYSIVLIKKSELQKAAKTLENCIKDYTGLFPGLLNIADSILVELHSKSKLQQINKELLLIRYERFAHQFDQDREVFFSVEFNEILKCWGKVPENLKDRSNRIKTSSGIWHKGQTAKLEKLRLILLKHNIIAPIEQFDFDSALLFIDIPPPDKTIHWKESIRSLTYFLYLLAFQQPYVNIEFKKNPWKFAIDRFRKKNGKLISKRNVFSEAAYRMEIKPSENKKPQTPKELKKVSRQKVELALEAFENNCT